MKGSRALLKMLEDRGVTELFGYPGGAIVPIYDEVLNSPIESVLVRHEQCAGHMADGFTRASGKPGVCLVTSGPGATNVVTGVATAYADSIPMMVLTGQVASGLLGLGTFQEVDSFSLMMPVTKYGYRILDLQQLPKAIDEGWKLCQSGRPGPVHIDLPIDSMSSEIDESLLSCDFPLRPLPTDMTAYPAALAAIMTAQRPAILAGGGVISDDATEELRTLAEMIGAPVINPLMGLGSIPMSHPLAMGPIGMHGRLSPLSVMKNADLLIAVGSKFSDRTYSPRTRASPECRIIHIDIDSTEFDKHNANSLNIRADLKDVMGMMIRDLQGKVSPHKDWLATAQMYKSKCQSCQIDMDVTPIAPQKVMYEINRILDDDTIVTTDVGQNQMWAMHHLKIERPRQFITSGSFGTMGFGLPSAIGAKIAKPDKKVMTITGDGGLLMVIQELATAIQQDVPVVICLLNNGWLGMVRQMQKLFWDKRYSATELAGANPDFVKLAESFGARGCRVERPGEIADAFRQAFSSDKPFLIDIWVDPEEDMLPMNPANPDLPLYKGHCRYCE